MTRPRMLFVTADLQKGLGDWIMSLPAVSLVRAKWGEYPELIGICPAHVLSLVEWAGIFDQALPYSLDWPECYADLIENALCVVALMDSDMYVYEDVKSRLERLHITTRILRNRFRTQQHHSLMICKNLDILGVDVPATTGAIAHPLTQWRADQATPGRVALHAGRGSLWTTSAKDWPHYQALAGRLSAEGWEVWQVVGPDDARFALSGVPAFTGDLAQVAQFLLSCSAFIGNDSGPGHLAGALGLPTLSIFGFTDPDLWHPIGPRVSWLRAASKLVGDVTLEEVLHGFYKRTMGAGLPGRSGQHQPIPASC